VPEVGYIPPRGTYLAWLDCRRLRLGSEPAEFFRNYGRVALAPGGNFGDAGQGFVRVTMATAEEFLREIVARMGNAVQSNRGLKVTPFRGQVNETRS
jgi:cysteine-S-conjugate beta-lyase